MNPYIQSLRLRTLPLSMSGIVLGSGIAMRSIDGLSQSAQAWIVFALAICTTLSLQILSNLSNELGDAQKGTDADQNERVAYGIQAGTITEQQMKRMIYLFIALCALFGTALIYVAFGSLIAPPSLIFFGLGLLAIIGAMTYTLGQHSYGYIGLGDLGVFLFFGLLSTIGAYYLQTQTVNLHIIACGIAIGLPCVGVLNLNNIRDMANDQAHGKRTFAGLLGQTGARVYHTLLLIGCLAIFVAWGHLRTLCILPIWAWHIFYIHRHHDKLDKQMPVLMFTTLIVTFLALI